MRLVCLAVCLLVPVLALGQSIHNGGAVSLSRGLYCSSGQSLSACVGSQVAGGRVFLVEGATYTISSTVTVSTPNVAIVCTSSSTTIQRDGVLTSQMLILSGNGSSITGCTIDGNGLVNTGVLLADVALTGQNTLARNNTFIKARNKSLSLSGLDARATGNSITGIGHTDNTLQTYGIWAIAGVRTRIDNNTITDTGIDGIGADGNGTVIQGNTVSACHTYTGTAGGMIVTYTTPTNSGMSVTGNTITGTGSSVSMGIEVDSIQTAVSGNTVTGMQTNGITLDIDAGFITLANNVVTDNGQSHAGSPSGLEIRSGVSHVTVTGGSYADDQGGGATQKYGVNIIAGTGDFITVTGANLKGNTSGAINNLATGLNNTFTGNTQ